MNRRSTPEADAQRAIVQALWGPEAGGHPGIAGGPRGLFLDVSEANRAAAMLLAAMATP